MRSTLIRLALVAGSLAAVATVAARITGLVDPLTSGRSSARRSHPSTEGLGRLAGARP